MTKKIRLITAIFSVLFGLTSYTTTAQGSSSLKFTSTNNNFIQWDDDENLIETHPNFTIEMWIKATESTNGKMIYCEGANSNSNMFRLYASGGKLVIRPNGTSADQIVSTGNNVFSDSRGWVHVAIVGETPNGLGTETTLSLYLDGSLNNSGTYTRVSNDHTRTVLGNLTRTSNQTSQYAFDGEIDELRTWSRALIQSELAINKCSPSATTNLVRHIRFNEAVGNTVLDNVTNTDSSIQGTTPIWTTNTECSSSLVAFYPFNGNANDESTNSNNGTVTDATLTTNRFGETNTAYEFNGTSSYIQIPDNDVFSISTTSKLSISVWMRVDQLDFTNFEGTGDYIHWLGKGSNGDKEWLFRMYNKSSDIRPNRTSCYAFNLSGGLGAGSYVEEELTVGEWIHYVMVYDYTTDTIKLYKNGELKDTDLFSDYTIVPANGTTPVRIGTSDFNSFFKGAIDDVRFYDGVLTSEEITNLYNEEKTTLSTSSEFLESINKLKFYPNPTNSVLYVKNLKELNTLYIVYDSYGRMVKRGEIKSGIINTNNLAPGVYVLNIINNESKTLIKSEKIIKK